MALVAQLVRCCKWTVDAVLMYELELKLKHLDHYKKLNRNCDNSVSVENEMLAKMKVLFWPFLHLHGVKQMRDPL